MSEAEWLKRKGLDHARPERRKFSKLAILAAILVICSLCLYAYPFFMLFLLPMEWLSGRIPFPESPALFFLGILALLIYFGGILFGALSISRIRRSEGRIRGLALAFAAVLFHPILFLTGYIVGLTKDLAGVSGFVRLILALLVDFFLIRILWRWAKRPYRAKKFPLSSEVS